MKRILPLFFLFVLLAACGGNATPTADPSIPSATPTTELAPPPTALVAPTMAPQPTATPDARLTPEEWQQWPVIPSITGRAIEIYQAGLAMGNDPHAFSKAGDCQNIWQAFMGYFDDPGRYNLGADYQYLQETIDNFSGYFMTDGQAVMGGFTPAAVLTPLRANPDVCLAGEGPLECELRVTKPSFVFVSFEVWWDGRTPDTYAAYLRQILDMIIARGAVPILVTKADNVEGDGSINLTTARLAHEYDLPLWNFWAAVQPLANHGMDPVRNDGFHISTDAWSVRSFTGLQTLDVLWRGLRDVSASGTTTTVTATPEAGGTSGLLLLPEDGPGLGSSTERVVFGLMARENGAYVSRGVYLFDPSLQQTVALLGEGYNFQSASPDGKTLLVNRGGSLYRTDGVTLTLLTDQFFPYGGLGALWLPDGRIAAILWQDGETVLVLMQSDGSGQTVVAAEDAPVEIYPSTDGTHLTWESGVCSAAGQCELTGAWLTNLSSGQSQTLHGMDRPLVAPDGSGMAYAYAPDLNHSNLAFAYFDGRLPREYPVYGNQLVDFAWQPGSSWLAVSMADRSDYSGTVSGGYNYLINGQDFSSRQLQSLTVMNPGLVWSPEGGTLLLFGTNLTDTTYSIGLWGVDADSVLMTEWSAALGLADPNYLFVTNAAWLARP